MFQRLLSEIRHTDFLHCLYSMAYDLRHTVSVRAQNWAEFSGKASIQLFWVSLDPCVAQEKETKKIVAYNCLARYSLLPHAWDSGFCETRLQPPYYVKHLYSSFPCDVANSRSCKIGRKRLKINLYVFISIYDLTTQILLMLYYKHKAVLCLRKKNKVLKWQ